jgi:DNA-binding LacI/PurR family transcriptional regulator
VDQGSQQPEGVVAGAVRGAPQGAKGEKGTSSPGGGRRPRIADVARAAGVSKTAVSFAFNQPERLNPETASRILEVARSLGYRPHPVARMLSQQRTGAIGIVTPQTFSVVFANPFFAEFAIGLAAAAEASGYALHFHSPLHGSLGRAIDRATVDGFVVIGISEWHPEVEQIRAAGLPVVLVDSTGLPELPSVDSDDEAGARAAAEHLLGLGHRRFLVVAVEPPPPAGRREPEGVMIRRLHGYRSALVTRDVELEDGAVVVGPASTEGGRLAFLRAWEDGQRPTAVLAMSDAMAVGVVHAARELGLRVPRDLSVVGFDDVEMAAFVDPPLTTVHQPVRRKGEEAVRLLLAMVEGRGSESPVHLRLETRLIVRASTGPAPDDGRR